MGAAWLHFLIRRFAVPLTGVRWVAPFVSGPKGKMPPEIPKKLPEKERKEILLMFVPLVVVATVGLGYLGYIVITDFKMAGPFLLLIAVIGGTWFVGIWVKWGIKRLTKRGISKVVDWSKSPD